MTQVYDSDPCPLALAPEALAEGAICNAAMWLSPIGIQAGLGRSQPTPLVTLRSTWGLCDSSIPLSTVRAGGDVCVSKAGCIQTESGNS